MSETVESYKSLQTASYDVKITTLLESLARGRQSRKTEIPMLYTYRDNWSTILPSLHKLDMRECTAILTELVPKILMFTSVEINKALYSYSKFWGNILKDCDCTDKLKDRVKDTLLLRAETYTDYDGLNWTVPVGMVWNKLLLEANRDYVKLFLINLSPSHLIKFNQWLPELDGLLD